MVTYSPRSITVHENDVPSVTGYNVDMRDSAGVEVLQTLRGVTPDPSGTTIINLASIVNADVLGTSIRLYVQEVGPTGATTDFQPVGDADGHGVFVVQEIPDGPESVVVNL